MTGTYEHSIDNAGRLIVPSKLRDKLGSAFYLAVGVKENLIVLSELDFSSLLFCVCVFFSNNYLS